MSLLQKLRITPPSKCPGWESLTRVSASLDAAQCAQFESAGYLVIPKLFSESEVAAVRARLFDLIHRKVPVPRGVKFEAEVNQGVAVDAADKTASYRQVWDLVPADRIVSENIALNPSLVGSLKSLLGPDIKLFRVIAMLKKSHIGSDLPYHQDSAYWPIEPKSMVSCWVAIDRATKENGCMRILPGLHKRGLLPFVTETNDGVTYRKLTLSEADIAQELSLEMDAGDCLFFHSLLPHATGPNHSDRNRFAIIASYMSAKSMQSGDGRKPRYLSVCGSSFDGKV